MLPADSLSSSQAEVPAWGKSLAAEAWRTLLLGIVVLTPLFAFSLRAQDNTALLDSAPFGFRCGMSAEQVIGSVGKAAVKESPGGLLQLVTAVKPNSAFASYSLLIVPKRGVVMINALGFNAGSSKGADLHGAFASAQDGLTRIYGAPAQSLDLAGDATFWVVGAKAAPSEAGPRHWAAVWNLRPPSKELVQGIVLDAEQASGFFFLSYECAAIEGISEQLKDAALSQTAVRTAFLPTTSPPIETAPATAAEHQVRYEVTATYYGLKLPVDIAYRDAAGKTVKVSSQVPWTLTFAAQPGQPLSLSAANTIDYGYIRCAIYLDGVLLKKDSDWGVGTVEVKANAVPARAVTHTEPSR